MPGTMLLGYDVESREKREGITRKFLESARELHNRLKVPATFFILGQTLEQNVEEFQAIAQDPLFDLQQHTYSHQLLKTLHIDNGESIRIVLGVTPEKSREEVRKANHLLQHHLDVDCIGLTGPWTYYRGLRDRPELVRMVWEEGIRFVRTDGRNEKTGTRSRSTCSPTGTTSSRSGDPKTRARRLRPCPPCSRFPPTAGTTASFAPRCWVGRMWTDGWSR